MARQPDELAGDRCARRARRRARCRGPSCVNALTAWLGYRARTVSTGGAIGGALIGAIIYAGGGAGAWVLLLLDLPRGVGRRRGSGCATEELLGIAEERGGRRGAGNAFANCGVAAVAAVAAVTTPYHGGWRCSRSSPR